MSDALEFASLFQRRTSERIKPGLERMRRAWDALGRPGGNIPSVLVGGTNGKGTTASFLKDLCHAGGLRVGIYTSPHLLHFRERVQLSDAPVGDEALYAAWRDIRARLAPDLYEELSFFELATLMALVVFALRQPDLLILEVGLGGRWDATNVVDPVASVLVSIGLDHCEYLGATLEAILAEKLGIARAKRPLFVGADVIGHAASRDEIIASAQSTLGFELYPLESLQGDDGEAATYLNHNYHLAARVYDSLARNQFPEAKPLDEVEAACPMPWTTPPLMGRMMSLRVPTTDGEMNSVLLDVCHNPQGVAATLQAWGRLTHPPRRALISILRDKDISVMLDLFQSFFHDVVLFKIPSERTFTVDHLASRHRELRMFESFAEAWECVSVEHGASEPWAICGSVLAVGHVLEFFGQNPEDDLPPIPSCPVGSHDESRVGAGSA